MASKIQFVEAENTDREYPNAFIIDEAMFKVNGVYVCVEPCGSGGGAEFLLGDQYIFVSSTGSDDSEEGLENDPFLTIAGAMAYVNSILTINGDIFVVFKDEGPFYINETVKINHPNKITFVGIGGDPIDPPDPEPGDNVWFGDKFVRMGTWTDFALMDTFSIASGGLCTGFGNVASTHIDLWYGESAASSDGTIGTMSGGWDEDDDVQTMEYITFATEAQAVIFGSLLKMRDYPNGCCNGVIALVIGGWDTDGNIEFISVEQFLPANLANSTYFGDLTTPRELSAVCANSTICLVMGGYDEEYLGGDECNYIEKFEFASGGVATSFGVLLEEKDECMGVSNETYAYCVGGDPRTVTVSSTLIEQCAFATEANSIFWGNLAIGNEFPATASDGDNIGVVAGGYYYPGSYPGTQIDTIDTFTINTPFTLTTDWGTLAFDDGSWVGGASGD